MKISVVSPLFNDWESLSILINEINYLYESDNIIINKIIVVNDGSNDKVPLDILNNEKLEIIDLATNLGHQRAICIGLCHVFEKSNGSDLVVVMDSDGEDKPEDILRLVNELKQSKKSLIFAKRVKRSEGTIFKIGYFIYKKLFYMLTGDKIRFGNFCCIRFNKIENIISNPDSWNHFSGAIIKSKLDYSFIPTDRGERYDGKSKMNFTSLTMHGLSSISLYIERLATKLLILNFSLVLISFSSLFVLLIIRTLTSYKIPGWTPVYTLGITNLLFFSLIFILFLVLVLLGNRSVVKKSPKSFYKDFILDK